MEKITFLLLHSLFITALILTLTPLSEGIFCHVIAVVLSSNTVMHGPLSELEILSVFENN